MRRVRSVPSILCALALALCFGTGCPGDGSEGQSPRIQFQSSAECLRFSGGFPSGFTTLPGSGREAAVVQFLPTAVLGLDLEREPPALLSNRTIPNFPGVPCPRCSADPNVPILGVDSDGNGEADICQSDTLGFRCLSPVAGDLSAIDADSVALSTSNFEQVVFLDPRDGTTREVELDTPAASGDFDPLDWPFWPAPGAVESRTALSTRACVYSDRPDSLGFALGANTFCDAGREGFVTGFTAGSARVGERLFVATSNLLRPSQARFAPGTVLVFDFDRSAEPPIARPHPSRAILLTSGYNPTSIVGHTTPGGRDLVLVTVSGAILIGTGPGLVRTESAIDVIDATSLELIATVPLGLAGLGDSGLAIDPSGRIALSGAFTSREIFGIDLAALDDPSIGLGAEPLPIVLDGSVPGFRDARIYTAARPFALPKRSDGPPDAQCSTLTSVALSPVDPYAVATDFCDGTITVLDTDIPASRATPIDPDTLLRVRRVENVAAPIVDTSTGLTRAIDRVRIRSGRPGLDFTTPEVYYTAGLEEGAVCGIRIQAPSVE